MTLALPTHKRQSMRREQLPAVTALFQEHPGEISKGDRELLTSDCFDICGTMVQLQCTPKAAG